MGERKTVNLKSPVTWIIVALCLAVGVGVGVLGNQSVRDSGALRSPPQQRSLDPVKGPSSPASKLERLQGNGYSIPVPEGTIETPEEIAAKVRKMGGLMVMFKRQQSDWFAGSVVVIPSEKLPDMESLNYLDDHTNACAEVNAIKLTKSKTQLAQLPSGRYCQRIGLMPNREYVGATLTLFKPVGVDAAWSVTCNYDIRDEAARAGCAEVLLGWRYDETIRSKMAAGPMPSRDGGAGTVGDGG